MKTKSSRSIGAQKHGSMPRIQTLRRAQHMIRKLYDLSPTGVETKLTEAHQLSIKEVVLQNKRLLICNSSLVNHLVSNWSHILSEINEWYDVFRGKYPVRSTAVA